MHHIEPTRLPRLLAQQGICPLPSEPLIPPLPPAARPAPAHWAAARDPRSVVESAHDFLWLGAQPELGAGG